MDTGFTVFMVVWVILGAASAYLLGVNRDAAFKRRVFPWLLLLSGVLFLGFVVVLMELPWFVVLIAAPVIALIQYLNLRFTHFCGHCGRTVLSNGSWFARAEFCPYCGAKLDR